MAKRIADELPNFEQPFEWDEQRSNAAIWLARGYTQAETATHVSASPRTIGNWMARAEFEAEVDRLSLMVDISGRAHRLRLAMRMVRKKESHSDRDLLEWLKYAQSETDGVKLDLAALVAAATPVADTGQDRTRPAKRTGTKPAQRR